MQNNDSQSDIAHNLRQHLKLTYGAGQAVDYKNNERHLSGFCLKINSYYKIPENPTTIARNIHSFTKTRKSLESELNEQEATLQVKIGDKKYLIWPQIITQPDKRIDVNFIELPIEFNLGLDTPIQEE
jgi:hypothetical protein